MSAIHYADETETLALMPFLCYTFLYIWIVSHSFCSTIFIFVLLFTHRLLRLSHVSSRCGLTSMIVRRTHAISIRNRMEDGKKRKFIGPSDAQTATFQHIYTHIILVIVPFTVCLAATTQRKKRVHFRLLFLFLAIPPSRWGQTDSFFCVAFSVV